MGAGQGLLMQNTAGCIQDRIDDQQVGFKHIVDVCLPNCLQCWKGILASEIAKEVNQESNERSFLTRIGINMQIMDTSGFVEQLFTRGSKKHGRKLVLVMIRFIFGMKGRNEEMVVKRLRRLGREHARLGVSESYMRLYNNMILRSLAECLLLPSMCPILNDWSLMLDYVVRMMCSEGYAFVRCDSSSNMNSGFRSSGFHSSVSDMASTLIASAGDYDILCNSVDYGILEHCDAGVAPKPELITDINNAIINNVDGNNDVHRQNNINLSDVGTHLPQQE